MRSSTRSLLFGASAVLLVLTVPAVVMRYLRRLTSALLMLCVCSTSALARPSGMFGPQQNPRATAVLLNPDEARQIAATLSDCETLAVELDSARAENGVLREALTLTERAAAAFEAASTANAERAKNEKQRAENETFLRATAESNLKRERRAGKWRALKWGTIALAAGVVVGVVMGGE